MLTLRPFFSFYGSKWRIARQYPAPKYRTVVEPFAGSAGYSLNYPDREVILYDLDPIIAGVWDYLIKAPEQEVRALPDYAESTRTKIPDEARWLMGFWFNRCKSRPAVKPSQWMERNKASKPGNYWGPEARERIASQQQYIRHWQVVCGHYLEAKEHEATWFIDPPYQKKGRHYRCSQVDYGVLAFWAATRKGQVMVCEQSGATWLPFGLLCTAKNRHNTGSDEVVWRGNAPT